jgi:CRISPR system Cascade subunit CasE
MPETLHLVKVPLHPEKLMPVARDRGLPIRELDEGYLAHVVLRELWQDAAPAPFVIRASGRALDAWGYSRSDAGTLIDHAAAFGDPSLLAAVGDIRQIASKPMPRFDPGKRIGFALRACPVVRLSGAKRGHRTGAEVDAFLARCFAVDQGAPVSREEVYRQWLTRAVSRPTATGVRVTRVDIAGMSRGRLLRRTQEGGRRTRRVERPDVRFEGELVVEDGDLFLAYLAHGVGRHRAFGFGALMLTPPGANLPGARGRC